MRCNSRQPPKPLNRRPRRHTTPQSVARAAETAILLRWPCPRLLIVQFRAFIDTLRLCPPVAHRPKLLPCRCSSATGSRPSWGLHLSAALAYRGGRKAVAAGVIEIADAA